MNSLLFLGKTLSGAVVLAFATTAQSLINIDFGGTATTACVGVAGAGLATNDVWNAYSHYVPRFTPGMSPVPTGRREGLRFADGSPSRLTVAVTNAPGVWGNATGDPMFDSYLFAPDGTPLTVTLTGLDSGRYHFLVYAQAEADVAPEQNSVLSLRTMGENPVILGPLTSAGGTGWKAGENWQEGRHYVTFRDVWVGPGEPVVLEVAPGSGGIAVLNGLQILSRGTAPPRLAQPAPLSPTDSVTNLLFRAIRYQGEVGGLEARFRVEVEVESRSTNTLSAVLFAGDIAVLNPKLPADWRLVNAGRQLVLVAGAPGSHTLEFDLVAKATSAEPWTQAEFHGPPAAIAQVTVTGPPGGEVQLVSGTVAEPAGTGSDAFPDAPVVHGALGADSRLALRWQGRMTEVRHESLVAVETKSAIHLTPSVIRHSTTIRCDVLQGRLARLSLLLPAGQTLTRIEGDALRDWQVIEDDDPATLNVEFLRPVESTATLTVLTEQAVGELPATVEFTIPQPLGVQRETGVIRLTSEDVVVQLEGLTAVRQINAGADELAAFRFSSRPAGLRAVLSRMEPVIYVTDRVQAELEEARWQVHHELGLQVTRAGIYSLEVELPTGWAVAEVAGEGIEDWKGERDVLRLAFGRRLLGERTLTIQLEQAFSAVPEQITLDPVRVRGAEREMAWIGVRAVPGLDLKTIRMDGVREVPVAAFPDHREEQLAFQADSGTWQISLSTERLDPRLVAEVFNLITVGDGVVGGSATLRYAIVNQGVQSFQVRLPAHWRNIEFTGPNLRRTDRQDDIWTLALQDKVWGAYTLVVTYDHAFDPKQAVLDAAGAHPLDVEREDGTVAVTAAPGLEIKAGPIDAPLRVIDPTELAATDRALISRPVLGAYRYEGTNFSLALNVTRHDQVAGLEAVTDRAQLTTVLTAQGEVLTQASFMVKNNERQYQRFQLPPGATLWGVAVNNEPVKAERDGDWVLISLPRSGDRDQTYAVDLNYAQQVGALGRLGGMWPRRLELVAPRTDVPGTYAEWELYTPPTRTVSGFSGNMTVARGTTYGLRDGWDQFVEVYAELWHRMGAALIVGSVLLAFVISLWILGRRKGVSGLMQASVIFALLFIAAGMLLPSLAKAKAKANRISSVNNLKNIGLAARIYATDHEGRMPENLADLMTTLGTEKVLVHPSTGERYTWVGAGKSEERPDEILAFGPAVSGGREVLLADGSVQQVTTSRFEQLLAQERSVPDDARSFYRMDPVLARRYGVLPKDAAADRNLAAGPMAAAAVPSRPVATAVEGEGAIPTLAGLRSLKIDVPKTGRAFQFTRTLNLNEDPPSVKVSVMSSRAFVVERTILQFAAFSTGLVLAWWQWRRKDPSSLWLAVGVGLTLAATVHLFISWRALHWVLMAGVPLVVLLVLLTAVSYWWKRWVAAAPRPEVPPSITLADPAAGVASLAILLSLFAWASGVPALGQGTAAPPVTAARSNLVSVVGATLEGTAGDRVARIEATLEFSSGGTNQSVFLFGPEVAVQEFSATAGDVRLWREGERVGALLPEPGTASARLVLLVKLGGDVSRRTLDFGLPPALGTRLSLHLEEPDADVEFPNAIAFQRLPEGNQTRVEAVLGGAGRLALAWTPRQRRAADPGAQALVHEVSLVTLGHGVAATRSRLDFTAPQGELRSLQIAIPPGQRVMRVTGELVRGWSYADTHRAEIAVELLKSAPHARIVLETESPLEALPAVLTVALPRPLEVKRITGWVAVRDGEELGLTLDRTAGLERIDTGEFAQAWGEEMPNVASAWRFLRPDFDLVVRAEVLAPRLEAVVNNAFQIGFEEVGLKSRVKYAISRAGVFALRLALPGDARVDQVMCPVMESWSERTGDAERILELKLKERTLGPVAVDLVLTSPHPLLPPSLDLHGVHPLGVDKLAGFVSVAAEPGIGVKIPVRTGLTEIPAAAMPGAQGRAGLLAFKQLAAEPGPVAAWTLSATTEVVDSWVRAEVATVMTVSGSLVTGRSVVRYDIQNAPLKEFRLRVPPSWRNVEINGAGLRRRDQTNSPPGVEWRVELQNKIRGEYQLTVQWEEPRTDSGELRLSGLETIGTARETGTIAFYPRGQLQLVPQDLGDQLLRVDAQEFPAWAVAPEGRPAVLTCRYLRPGWNLSLEVKRYRDAELLQALVDAARLRTVVAEDGQMMTQLELKIRNNGRQNLGLVLPEGAAVWSALVDGEPVRPAKDGGRLLVPLENALGGEAVVTVELTYVAAGRFPATSGRVKLESPRLDVPLKDARWDLFLPPDYDYRDFGGSMTYESADLVPVSQDFTLGSYRRQELEQRATVASQTLDRLEAAKKEVAAGRYDHAGRLNFLSSRGPLDDSRQQDLKALEETLNLAQSSNLLQAQRSYAANNAAQLGGSATGNRPEDYDAEVAARQVAQLNRAQAVAVGRVTPLHVNLPTRGIRHTFGQVLQTEVDRPLSVEFHARNERATGVFKTILLWGGGFLGLWALALIALVFRPAPKD